MSKIYLDQMPKGQEMLEILKNIYPDIDPLTYHNFILLRKISIDLDNSLEAFFGKFGISAGRFSVIMILYAMQRGVMPSELAQVCGVTQATVSGLLTGLEKADLIIRKQHEQDGRAFVIHLSEKGEGILKQLMPSYFERIEKIFSKYTPDQRRELVSLLEMISDEIKTLSEPPSGL